MTTLPDPYDLSSSSCSCRAYAHGAHVVEWTPVGDHPGLWLSPLARLDSSSAIRGGVPIVFPWFGGGASGTMTPSHGFGRLSDWQLASIDRSADQVEAEFRLDSSQVSDEEFPYAYRASYVVSAGRRLELALTVSNDGDAAFTYEDALHAYLGVGDVRRVTVEGLDGAEYADKVAGPTDPMPLQSGPIRFESEVDRVYRSTGQVRVIDPVLERTLTIRKSGSRSTIVWNPGPIRAAEPKAADIGPDHWHEFVCVEGGNVAQDAVTLAPGESGSLTYAIDIVPHVGGA
jgi:glucose-6-phosphate 1-epimerase